MPGPRMGRIFLSPPSQPSREACSRRLLVGFRGPWRRIKEDDDAALRIFSVSPSALSSLSLLAPRISLPFNFFLSDFVPLPSPPRPDCIADRFSVLFNLLSTTEVAEDLLFLFNRPPRDSFCFPFPLPLCLRSLKTSRRVLFRESLRRFIIFPPAEEKLSLRRRNALTFNVKNLATISQRRTIKFPRSLDLFRLLFGSNFSDYRSLNKVFFEFHFLSRYLFLISILCFHSRRCILSLSLSFPNL